MHFLVIDVRFATPIYVFLERDPSGQDGYPNLTAREVTLDAEGGPPQLGRGPAIGRDPEHLERFREFASDVAVARAGFILVEPRYVGPNWEGYCRHFRPEGEKPVKRAGRAPAAMPGRG